jgi:magnesium chelatase family protein
LDELPEFPRETLEALRQPLEDRVINVARAKESAEYPANFVLIATANPCPCGFFGSEKACSCSTRERQNYRNRLSGPILDRIDLHSNVSEVDHEKLLTQEADSVSDQAVRDRIQRARQIQNKRFASPSLLNADLSNDAIKKYVRFESGAANILNIAARQIKMSARAYMRTIKVAQTIADLEASTHINQLHLGEALSYRTIQTKAKS